ncbi:DUF4232 domain-containing protein [Streptomyces sp. NBC_00237]|uniref:DUF4232 domain-containing protein n=1 Tax=Streptomyces sp. NBC_00237 TaxID=2975687 RepID=UPI00225A2F15|nr:DUF4232 domain-containing protein [Streptomyces sp. NBC_00237]MCX5201988.1 DUF4232 domain-containing protein [Streptomyces sp. NBC_00237]
MSVRTGTKVAAAALFGALFLSGCDGFLVPSGEGEQQAEESGVSPSPSDPGRPTAPPTATVPPAVAAPSAGAAYDADCPAGVRVDMGEIQAALMHRLAVLTLTNCGDTPYELSGRPSVKAYAADGTAVDIEVDVKEEGKRADAVVLLPPGGVAYSRLDWRPYDGVEKAQTLKIAAGPGHDVRSFPLEEDVRMVDAFDVTPWALTRPQ